MKGEGVHFYKRRWSPKQILVLLLVVLLAGAGLVLYYRGEFPGFSGSGVARNSNIEYYTCPMHPQIHEDHPGHCPICHMDLVPVYKPGHAPEARQGETSTGETAGKVRGEEGAGSEKKSAKAFPPPGKESPVSDSGREGEKREHDESSSDPELIRRGGVHISRERMQLIGVRTTEAKLMEVHSKIETSGRVAFDPDLAVAIQEYLEVARRDPSLRRAAVSRLRLMGMGDDEIRHLGKKGDRYSSLYLPGKSSSIWVYANVYESDMGAVRPGAKAVVRFTYESGRKFSGVVRSLAPNVDPVTRSITARIEVSAPGGELRPDSFVNVQIDHDLGKRVIVPSDAVIYTGTRAIVFVEKGPGLFVPREVETGESVAEGVVVYGGLSPGERVVFSGAFLIDSESQLRPVPLDTMPSH